MKLIILDRDGVINEDSDAYIKGPDEWVPIPGSLEAIARLNSAGYLVVVATNQSGLARGLFDIEDLDAIHQKLHTELSRIGGHLDGIFFCPHHPEADCACRKPRPGLYQAIGQRFNVPLVGVPMIGDSLGDLLVAQTVGGYPVLVRSGKGRRTEVSGQLPPGIEVFADLAAVVQHLLKNSS
jgi:D-glycero-D-manno-heptose 1,7-bisphosphate phosphatase